MEKILGLYILLFISVLAYYFFIPHKWRSLFLLLLSLLFIACYNIQYACYFLFNIILVYRAGIFIEKENNKKIILQFVLIWLIGNICFFKYTEVLFNAIERSGPSLNSSISFPEIILPLGFSYITFRLIHYIVEVYRKNMPRGSFIDFALYVLFFPTFLAGPVERFQRFYPQTIGQKDVQISDINYGLFRIIGGLVKKFIIADYLAKWIMPVLYMPQHYTKAAVVLSIYGLAIRIYMDFAGYTDMAIGTARLFGYKIMENFDRPFLKKNIALFWRSWHISIYNWIRDYFFFPFFGHRPSALKIYAGIFFSMLGFHLWHKGSLSFFILGTYHGLGLVAWHLFQEIKRKYPLVARFTMHRYLDPISTFATFSFVSFGVIFFSLSIDNAFTVLQKIF